MIINFSPAGTFRGTQVLRQAQGLAYAYETTDKAVDADGAPNAYHPDDVSGLDALGNAGYGHPHQSWWPEVLVPDPQNPSVAYVQPGGPFAGFFVAQSALRKPHGTATDPATYVDATKVPYVVIPTGFEHFPGVTSAKPGDVGYATNLANGKTTAFIVGDAGGGSTAKLGEGSIALWVALGGVNPNPRNGHGVPPGSVQYILFPGSRKPGAGLWPRTQADIDGQVAQLLTSTPGIGQAVAQGSAQTGTG